MTIGVFFAFMVERTDMPMKSFAYAVVPLTIAIPGLLYWHRLGAAAQSAHRPVQPGPDGAVRTRRRRCSPRGPASV